MICTLVRNSGRMRAPIDETDSVVRSNLSTRSRARRLGSRTTHGSLGEEDGGLARTLGVRNNPDYCVANPLPETQWVRASRLEITQGCNKVEKQVLPGEGRAAHLITRTQQHRQCAIAGGEALHVIDQRAPVPSASHPFVDNERMKLPDRGVARSYPADNAAIDEENATEHAGL
jgi:hypothetical protein